MKNSVKLILLPAMLAFAFACKKSDNTPPPVAATINGLTPSRGPENTVVAIAGAGFSTTASANQVYFNGKPATVIAATATELTVNVPQRAGTGSVTVVTNGKTAAGPVFTYLISDAQVTTFAGSGNAGFTDGAGTAASFDGPVSVAIDTAGNLYVSEVSNAAIRKITPAGVVTTLAGGGIAGYVDGTGTAARFSNPQSVAVDASGNVYVADYGNYRIRKITPAGVVSTFAGSGVAGYANGAGINAQFSSPIGIAIDNNGNLYVSDQSAVIRMITSNGLVSTFCGRSTQGYTDGAGGIAQFSQPRGLITDKSGNVYVSDLNNARIRKITPAGVATTVAGSNYSTDADGPAATCGFSFPLAVALDSSNNILVSDYANNRIRMIDGSSMVSTLAGGEPVGYADGNKATAKFSGLGGIAVDKYGAVYVVDVTNNRIRKIVLE